MRGIPVGSSCVRNRGPGQSVFVYTGTSIGITAQKDRSYTNDSVQCMYIHNYIIGDIASILDNIHYALNDKCQSAIKIFDMSLLVLEDVPGITSELFISTYFVFFLLPQLTNHICSFGILFL